MYKKRRNIIRETPKYNVEMIRDFIEHLKWELRIKHFENQQIGEVKINPELVEQLKKYIVKWNTNALLLTGLIETDKFDSDKLAQVKAEIKKETLEQCQTALDALDKLEPVLNEAFNCAGYPDQIPTKIIGPDGVDYGFLDESKLM
jgi:hypothetical protein